LFEETSTSIPGTIDKIKENMWVFKGFYQPFSVARVLVSYREKLRNFGRIYKEIP